MFGLVLLGILPLLHDCPIFETSNVDNVLNVCGDIDTQCLAAGLNLLQKETHLKRRRSITANMSHLQARRNAIEEKKKEIAAEVQQLKKEELELDIEEVRVLTTEYVHLASGKLCDNDGNYLWKGEATDCEARCSSTPGCLHYTVYLETKWCQLSANCSHLKNAVDKSASTFLKVQDNMTFSQAFASPKLLVERPVLLAMNSSRLPDGNLISADGKPFFEHSDFAGKSLSFVGCFIIYTVFCVWYETTSFKTRNADPMSQLCGYCACTRFVEWDIMRFIVEWTIVANHLIVWCRPLWMATESNMSKSLSVIQTTVFAFISGIFGASMARSSISRMLCYTIGTNIIFTFLSVVRDVLFHIGNLQEVAHILSVAGLWQFGSIAYTNWYMMALLAWRLTVVPLFHIGSRYKVHPFFCWAFVLMVSYTLRHSWILPAPMHWGSFGFFLCSHAPSFALGLLTNPNQWTKLVRNPMLQCYAVVTTVVGFGGLILVNHVEGWEDALSIHLPHVYGQIDIGAMSAACYIIVYTLTVLAALSPLWLIAALVRGLEPQLPRLLAVCADCGSRALYTYVLHVFVWETALRMRVMGLFDTTIPYENICLFLWLLSFHVNALLSCRAAEYLFKPLIRPYWLLEMADVARTRFDNQILARRKHFLTEAMDA